MITSMLTTWGCADRDLRHATRLLAQTKTPTEHRPCPIAGHEPNPSLPLEACRGGLRFLDAVRDMSDLTVASSLLLSAI